jgi:hypothetical protein
MTTISHSAPQARERHGQKLLVPDVAASLAIAVIWLCVLFDAIYGPDLVTRSAGGDFVSFPSVIVVAFFAFLATWVVARHGFRGERRAIDEPEGDPS